MRTIRFETEDLHDELPPSGWHAAQVSAARYRRSASGNRMIQVSYALLDAGPGHVRLAEYFVLEGASPEGVAVARRRLVALYHAAGLDPKPGEAITPADLLGAGLEIELVPETWQGRTRMRVADHRPRPAASAGGAPF